MNVYSIAFEEFDENCVHIEIIDCKFRKSEQNYKLS